MIINMTGGGGGAALNFDVKAYATEEALLAATPKENTIGVITQTAITSWAFSATEPAEPVAGMVWISTGDSSGVAFNALKKNAIQVYPLSAKQYVDGAWVDVTAMSYQGGEWVEWLTAIFDEGKLTSDYGTFGNVGKYYYMNDDGNNKCAVSHSISDTLLVVKWTSSGVNAYDEGMAYFTKPFNLTDKSEITIDIDSISNLTRLRLFVTKEIKNKPTAAAEVDLKIGECSLDVSELDGSYYIAIQMYNSHTESHIAKIRSWRVM